MLDPPNWFQRLYGAIAYWVRCRVRRYDLVRMKDIGLNYEDTDMRMFVACFVLLGEFLERSLGRATPKNRAQWGEFGVWYHGYRLDKEGDSLKEAIDLWHWYKSFQSYWEAHNSDEADAKLKRLIEIRECLWV